MDRAFNAGHYQIDGTDLLNGGEPRTDEAYLRYRQNWRQYPAKMHVADFPLHVDIESTNLCNLRCEYCTRNELDEGFGRMPFDLFKKIIDEGAQWGLASIKLNRRGEPLLHKELVKFIRYAKERGILDVQFNTHAMLLTEEVGAALIEAGLDRIIFSLDGVDKAVFEAMRPGARYETVVENIRQFVALRHRMGRSRPLTRIQMTVSDANIAGVEEYIATWRDVVNKISFNLRRQPMIIDGKKGGPGTHYPCPQLWQRIAVYYNGDVVMCCGDWHKHYLLGNAYKDSIRDLWLSEKYNEVRRMHAAGRHDEVPICRNCEYNMVKSNSRLEQILAQHAPR